MRKMISLSSIVLLSFSIISWGQYYNVEWAIDTSKGEVLINYDNYLAPANYKPFDYDNDGISDLYVLINDSIYRYELLNGASHSLSYKIKKYYNFSSNTYCVDGPDCLRGFWDIDVDGIKEGVLQVYDTLTFNRAIAFINLSSDLIEYVKLNTYSNVAFSDIDNDGYIELITQTFVLGHSTTPTKQPASLIKIASPSSRVFPNPSSGSTRIDYYVPVTASVKVSIFDMSGKLIRVLINENKKAGNFTEQWNGRANDGKTVAAGQYYYNIQIGEFVTNNKLIVLK